ncbi:MAG TPA: hypothetical protein VMV49_04290 [Candidatus Deferrimicrobium sp.]|nr:hypothetical protein [Candidatus Deferrimicrobium sp.]
MGRRLYKMGVDKYAKGQSFELEKKDRYYINIALESLKTLKDYDIGRGGEFYFKVRRTTTQRRRVPDRGEIRLMENQDFSPRQDFTLWTEFIELKQGDSKDLELDVALYERDIGVDDKIFKETLQIRLGSETDYKILENENKSTKAKIRVSAGRTRY